jgi:hypothetical protein
VIPEQSVGAGEAHGRGMYMLAEWEAILTNDLDALKQLTGKDEMSRMRHAMKEQEIGQHCYQAGEMLADKELLLLKKALSLTEQQWRAYKSKIRPAPE